MGLHNILKNAKIAEDLFVYFMEKGFQSVGVTITNKQNETVFEVKLLGTMENVIKTFKEQFYCNRDVTIEEYGWEVIVENDSDFELEHLGYQIDSYCVNKTDDGHTINLVRKKL